MYDPETLDGSDVLIASLEHSSVPLEHLPVILIVDDVPDNLRLLSATLSQAGYLVRGAISGQMALTGAVSEPPDLILLDVNMPEMDGIEVCRRLKTNYRTSNIPVIFLSALGETWDKVKAFDAGGEDYITKPFHIDEVLVRVHHQLELARLQKKLREQNQQLQMALKLRETAEAQVRHLNQFLEQRIVERTWQLQATNRNLQWEMQERQKVQARLLHLAMHDALTGLPNRTCFLEYLGETLKRINLEHTSLSELSSPIPSSPINPSKPEGEEAFLLVLDCDRFSSINNTLGHQKADQLLVTISNRLTAILPPESIVARLNGDEFSILSDGSHQFMEVQVQTILDTLTLPIQLGNYEVSLTPSIGIAVAKSDYEEAEHWFRDAYQAMADAKQDLPGSWRIFRPDIQHSSLRRLGLEGKLRHALQENQLELKYQPIVQLQQFPESSPIVGFEALVRWSTLEDGPISPEEFIPIAEASGLILPLGDWVFQTACRQIKVWNQGRSPEQSLFMSINCSMPQINQVRAAQHFKDMIESSEVQAQWLKLEITESVFMKNPDITRTTLEQLRQFGMKISIDDFGTGYSSLSYLTTIPVDILKIDRSFIRDLSPSKDDFRLLETILTLAQAFELEVVAEGLETSYQAHCLKRLGSSYGQGNYFSFPLDSEDIEELLRQQK